MRSRHPLLRTKYEELDKFVNCSKNRLKSTYPKSSQNLFTELYIVSMWQMN